MPHIAARGSVMPSSAACLIRVVLDVPLAREFDYCAPSPLTPGVRVAVTFAHRRLCAVVLSCPQESAFVPKPISAVLDELPPLPEDWLRLVRFAADYYCYPLGQTLFTALPGALRQPTAFSPTRDPLYTLTAAGSEWIPSARAPRQQRLHLALSQSALPRSAVAALGPGMTTLADAWCERGLLQQREAEMQTFQVGPMPPLTQEQQQVLAVLSTQKQYGVTLLHGVTGSGKTEVYLRLVERALAAGQQVLVLVPEINLTPQLEARFRARFPHTPLASLHSNVSEQVRASAWVDAWQGRVHLVLGTRLAVFTPLPHLGLIVVDEEHDSSFKQQDGLRYSARDLAIWRARDAQVPIILGSATPSLETLANVERGRYQRLRLTQRATAAPLPTIRLLDIRRQPLQDGLSEPALQALAGGLQRGEMSLVYLNRRGWSPVLACTDCGWIAGCPSCSAKLVLHWAQRKLMCHHCGHTESITHACPSCGNPDLKPLGQGTQRVEAALNTYFPQARILRIDRDTTQRKRAWERIYQQVHAGEVDILLGTQMLAKGHDFPSLSTVVALNTDGGLYSTGFRAAETLFAQLMQVAGRAGRAQQPGTVWIQTQLPEHPLYQALCQHDFDGYAAALLAERQAAGWPPAVYQALLRADASAVDDALNFLRAARASVPENTQLEIYPPVPALMARVAQRERAQLLIQAPTRAVLHAHVHALAVQLPPLARPYGSRLRWSIDVDPLEM